VANETKTEIPEDQPPLVMPAVRDVSGKPAPGKAAPREYCPRCKSTNLAFSDLAAYCPCCGWTGSQTQMLAVTDL